MQSNEKKMSGYPSIDKPWLKYYSEDAINTPLPQCTIYEYLWENNKENLNDIALSYFDREITYREMFENIDKAVNAFWALGVRPDDIVAITTVTTPETIYAFYALNRLGAISNMIDPRTSTEGIKQYIEEGNSKWVLTIDAACPKIEKAVEGTNVKGIIVVSPSDSLPVIKKVLFNVSNKIKGTKTYIANNYLKWDEFLGRGRGTKSQYLPYKENTCCVIVHTGGTTGTPKGVMLSNDNLNVMALQYRLMGVEFDRIQKFLDIMPPFIAYGVVLGIHMPLCLGLSNVLIPQLDPNKFADLIIKYKPAHLAGVPTHFDRLRNNRKMENVNLEFFENAGVGGDAVSAGFESEINAFLKEHNCKYEIAKGYGMTEVSSAATTCRGTVNKFQSVGTPHLKTIVGIFEPDTDTELKYNQQGEVCICAPTVMLGYYDQKEETAKILKKHSDGMVWIHSGDIGHMDEDGFLFIDGRIKRLIIRHDGFKVFPSLIENKLVADQAVKECCVIGMPDKGHSQGELPFACIVLETGFIGKESIVRETLIKLCENELPEYAQPMDFKFLSALPLTPIGKVDYRALKEVVETE